MSQILIQQYLNQLQDLRKVSGTHRESVVREAFKDLLKGWARSHDLVFVPEYEIETKAKDRRYVDGALLYELRMPFGYCEAKDEKDDLDAEIEYKFRRGFARGKVTTNTIEGVFSIFKRGLVGTYRHIGTQHLEGYTSEFDFRYNNREKVGVKDEQRTDNALKGISG